MKGYLWAYLGFAAVEPVLLDHAVARVNRLGEHFPRALDVGLRGVQMPSRFVEHRELFWVAKVEVAGAFGLPAAVGLAVRPFGVALVHPAPAHRLAHAGRASGSRWSGCGAAPRHARSRIMRARAPELHHRARQALGRARGLGQVVQGHRRAFASARAGRHLPHSTICARQLSCRSLWSRLVSRPRGGSAPPAARVCLPASSHPAAGRNLGPHIQPRHSHTEPGFWPCCQHTSPSFFQARWR